MRFFVPRIQHVYMYAYRHLVQPRVLLEGEVLDHIYAYQSIDLCAMRSIDLLIEIYLYICVKAPGPAASTFGGRGS